MATYVVWPGTDQVSWDLVRGKFPEYEPMKVYWNDPRYAREILVDKNGVEYPIEPEPSQIADNDLILLGGSYPNPYVKKYFVDSGIIKVDPDKEIMIGTGVYANGKRCITSTTRPNGTKVIGIFGWNAIDTLYATEDYLRIGPLRELWPRIRGFRGVAQAILGVQAPQT